MKSKIGLLRVVLTLIFLVVDIRLLQHKFSNIAFALLLTGLGYLLFTLIRTLMRKGTSSRYERKPQSPWGALNEGIDPSL